MGRVTIQLQKPIRLTDIAPVVSELYMRDELCTGDLRGIRARFISDPTFDEIVKIASRLAGQPEELLNKMSIADFDQVGAAVLNFFGNGQAIGTTPSPGSPTSSDSPPPTSGQ